MFYMDFFLQTQAISPKRTSQQEGPKNWEDYFNTAGALCSFVVGSAFVGASISVATRQLKLLCLGLSSTLFFERVWVTQGLLCTSPRVVLDKTPRTSKQKFAIGRFTLSILNPLGLMLTEL